MPNGVPYCTRFNELFTSVPGGCFYSEPVQINGTWVTPNSAPVFDGTELRGTSSNGYAAGGIKTDGTLWTWGRDDLTGRGCILFINISSPVQTVSGGTNWRALSFLQDTAMGLKTDGTLWLWGGNNFGRLGNQYLTGTVSSPVQTIAGGSNWCKITVTGGNRGMPAAIKSDGTLWTWGSGTYGQLGNGVSGTTASRSSPVQTVSGGTNWRAVASGSNGMAAIKTDGTLWLWGRTLAGRLGTGALNFNFYASPVQTISGGTNWKQVSLGSGYTTTATKTDGTLWLWGYGESGQLGNNISGFSCRVSSPVQTISGGTTWLTASNYNENTVGIKTDGTLWWWGCNRYNRFNSSLASASSPVLHISAISNWSGIQFSNGTNRPLQGITADGKLFRWGCNQYGRIGNDTFPGSVTDNTFSDVGNMFVEKDYLLDVYPQLACNFKASALWGWGNNTCGALGNYSTTNQSSPVQTISGGTDWKQIAAGDCVSAGIKATGTLWAWGTSSAGVLGNNTGSFANVSSPVQTIAGGNNWAQVSTKQANIAAIKTDGTLWLWGAGGCGQIGDNQRIARSSPVQTISGGTNWKQVSLNNFAVAAIKTDGTLWTWGINSVGQLADNTTISRSSPVQTISGGTNWKQVSWTRAIKTDGTLWTWGFRNADNSNPLTGYRSSPVQTLSGGTNWKTVSYNTAIKTDGTLWSWGTATGDNYIGYRSSPVQTVSRGSNWKSVISSTQGFTVAIKTDGTIWGWGYNASGSSLGCNLAEGYNFRSPVQLFPGNSWRSAATGFRHTLAIKEEGDW